MSQSGHHIQTISSAQGAAADNFRRSENYVLERRQDQLIVTVQGQWDIHNLKTIDRDLTADLVDLGYRRATEGRSRGVDDSKEHSLFHEVVFDFENLGRMDTAGAYVLTRAIGCQDGFCRKWRVENASQAQIGLMTIAANASRDMEPEPAKPWYDLITRFGKACSRGYRESLDTISFFGKFVVTMLSLVASPRRIRWKSVVSLVESVGLDAVPIVALLSFFIGAVIAFMGTDLLEAFGAKVFVVDLVGIAVLREFAVLITAILLAGRSNSAFTAQIGSMKMRQEIDAMTVIGLNQEETLVAPRAIACLIAMPILTFCAMVAGLAGGMLVAWSQGISPTLFMARTSEIITINHFWVGMVKSPVFALVIAIIGCRQGLAVTGSVESLGARTTSSVVQAIFSIIVLDAMFAMLFLRLDI